MRTPNQTNVFTILDRIIQTPTTCSTALKPLIQSMTIQEVLPSMKKTGETRPRSDRLSYAQYPVVEEGKVRGQLALERIKLEYSERGKCLRTMSIGAKWLIKKDM
jgi:hypothetical protein